MTLSTLPPKGFRDFIYQEAKLRSDLIQIITQVFSEHGFHSFQTSAVENLQILLGKAGDENEKLLFKILKRGDEFTKTQGNTTSKENDFADLGLRFDLTVPLSRISAQYRNEIKLPYRGFQIGSVWRAERPQKGRFREFTQADADIIGAKGAGAEFEVIQAGANAIAAAGGEGFDLRINDRRILHALLKNAGIAEALSGKFLILLDKKDKIDVGKLKSSMEDLIGKKLPETLANLLDNKLHLDDMQEIHPQATENMDQLLELIDKAKLPIDKITFDPSLARGLDYYTGTIYELRHASAGYSFGAGGRYDNLIGQFLKETLPAVGFSIGFDRLLLLLKEKQAGEENRNEEIVFFPVFNENLRSKTNQLAGLLRKRGMKVDVYAGEAKLKKQMKYANEMGFRWVILLGEDEVTSNTVKIKDYRSGSEEQLAQDEFKNWKI